MVQIKKVENKKDLNAFIDFPYALYADDPLYAPDLRIVQKETLDKKKNPFFHHADADYFIALDENGKVKGRIAAITNDNYVKHWKENYGFFGFFETVNDKEVAKALFDAALGWLKDKGVEGVYGPMNPSTNDTCGTLVNGFDTPPYVMMVHNKPYYDELIKAAGFQKKMDLFSYRFAVKDFPLRYIQLADKIEERLNQDGIYIRQANFKKIREEAPKLRSVYNKAWEKNWGFIPMDDDEFDALADELKMVTSPDLVYIAEDKGKPVAFIAVLPDLNQITRTIRNGRLFPFNFLKLINFKKKVNRGRVLTLGLIDGYRLKGIDTVMYARCFKAAKEKGYVEAEASWILENNTMMNRILQNIKADPYKTYRIYSLDFK
ncbi:hypothetical protein LA303_07360 [Candidatus Sulfidibacterium hydrothermale]|uniref:hypothetical protein n=1 Tax=Candidatus Sulfidibacterium hydrothermale TaxID=2875962 RepID=UPI001F0B2607|nr:hypothetical protein [Candidatus Sulfidibacterium hydrothermale]UBM61241.1 hypothetical protein LA303_07360 [Candidatus Sulfidibacterium hydrothermale]